MFSDFLAIWAPVLLMLVAFLITGMIVTRGDTPLSRFKTFVSIFLKEPASVKTWALAIAAPVLCLMLSGVVAKVADNASWPMVDVVMLARIQFFREVAWGLLCLIGIVLGALGAVSFKGQLPGGASIQVNPDGSGSAQGQAAVPSTGGGQ